MELVIILHNLLQINTVPCR